MRAMGTDWEPAIGRLCVCVCVWVGGWVCVCGVRVCAARHAFVFLRQAFVFLRQAFAFLRHVYLNLERMFPSLRHAFVSSLSYVCKLNHILVSIFVICRIFRLLCLYFKKF